MVAVPTAKQQQLVDSLAAAVAAAASGSPSLLPGFTSEFLYRRWYRSNMRLSTFLPPADEIPRVDYGSLNPQSYYNRYDLPAQPVILTGFMSAEWPEGWQQHWQLDQLAELYCDRVFRASRPLGGKTKMRFRDYVDYMLRQADEEPLYIFDEDFADSAPEMLDWYKAPSVIVQDHTSVLGELVRPNCKIQQGLYELLMCAIGLGDCVRMQVVDCSSLACTHIEITSTRLQCLVVCIFEQMYGCYFLLHGLETTWFCCKRQEIISLLKQC
eukprot:GHRR01028497.1.p1 GENE.GHRR01028497.1~~GHRR01028497.1.p1  ORF type:complete len:280 (-),score=82.80 GHRR01028497.1:448-1254(-)